MAVNYVESVRVLLREEQLNEQWLQDRIAEKPGILGLPGEPILLTRERRQEQAGRLDLMLHDYCSARRYEVALMLGAIDETQIVRCIELWDVERRRYPACEHVAVLIAEDVARFMNVLVRIIGTIPLVVIRLVAARIEDRLTLSFVKVLDQDSLPMVETVERECPSDLRKRTDQAHDSMDAAPRGGETPQSATSRHACADDDARVPSDVSFAVTEYTRSACELDMVAQYICHAQDLRTWVDDDMGGWVLISTADAAQWLRTRGLDPSISAKRLTLRLSKLMNVKATRMSRGGQQRRVVCLSPEQLGRLLRDRNCDVGVFVERARAANYSALDRVLSVLRAA